MYNVERNGKLLRNALTDAKKQGSKAYVYGASNRQYNVTIMKLAGLFEGGLKFIR